MAMIERFVDVEAPASTAYNTWTQFELFPHFMEGVEEVRRTGQRHLRWRADIWGETEEWDAEITEQIPDKRIAWRSEDGASNAGVVTFHRLSDDRARVMLQMEYGAEHLLAEKVGDVLGIASHRVEADLMRFKAFVERYGDLVVRQREAIPAKEDAGQRERRLNGREEAEVARVIPLRSGRVN